MSTSTLLTIAFVLLVISWHVPYIGRTLAGLLAFLSAMLMLNHLFGERARQSGCVVIERPPIAWWLIGLGFAAAMFAVTEIALRRRRAEHGDGLARAIVLR